MKALIIGIWLGAALVGVQGCQEGAPRETVSSNNLSNVARTVDVEAGVACWVYKNGYAGGIDCMPLEDTRLGQ